MENHSTTSSKEKISDSTSMELRQDPNREITMKLKATTFVQLIGQELNLSQNCICTATIFFHRFYMFYYPNNLKIAKKLGLAAVILAGKAKNEFRRLEHVIKVACYKRSTPIDVNSELYLNLKDELLSLELVLLQVLGFEMNIELPHPHVIRICQIIEEDHELAKKAYLLATASIMVSTLCLLYKPIVVACVCVNLAARWSQLEIQLDTDEHPWCYYMDPSLSAARLNELTDELEKNIIKGALLVKSPVLNCVPSGKVVKKAFRTSGTCKTENSNNDLKPAIAPSVISRT